jgi:hypothetical protein
VALVTDSKRTRNGGAWARRIGFRLAGLVALAVAIGASWRS